MGSNDHYPEEAPAHKVTVPEFSMDTHVVINADFRKFVDATGYITMAESTVDPADYPAAAPEMLVPASIVFARQPARS